MGAYTDNLSRRFKVNRLEKRVWPNNTERLVAAAIKRNGETHSGGFKSHAEVRKWLGDANPYDSNPADIEGFITNTGRFLDRAVARMLAIDAGQVSPSFNRELLSSDINW
jgi:hypothetical protein